MLRTIGLMSGTSLDGVDAAWVETRREQARLRRWLSAVPGAGGPAEPG